MKISIISFSRSGYRIGEMLSWFLGEGGHEVEAFTKSKYTKKILDESQVEADDKAFRNVKEFAKPIDSSLRDWTGRRFAQSDAIIFIGPLICEIPRFKTLRRVAADSLVEIIIPV